MPPKLIKVLLVQGNARHSAVVREALREAGDPGFLVEHVTTCSRALEQLNADPAVAAVLVDLCLSDSTGIHTFDQLVAAAPQLPILVLSAARDEAVARLAVQRGAQDYLIKTRIDGYVLNKAIMTMIERAASVEALFVEKERAEVMLNSIGDAVLSIDAHGAVTYLNRVAEGLTGWSRLLGVGRQVSEVLQLIDATTRERAPNPLLLAMRGNTTVCLAPNCILVRRDGVEAAIEDSAAPIHNRKGAVTGAIMVFHDVSMSRALSLKASYLAQHDLLTDLPNRSLLHDRLTQAISVVSRQGRGLAVLVADLDRFKYINNALGHAAGDRLLQMAAQRLRASVRTCDLVSRQSGDEFVILLSDVANRTDASACAGKVLLALGVPCLLDGEALHVTASVGVAMYPEDGTDADTLLKHADFAMYQAKDHGRNNCQFFEARRDARANARQSLETSLYNALQGGQFVLHYQPIVTLATGAILGVEALLRWSHPERGMLSPAEFMPIAEESGLIVPIGRWVLKEACRQTRAWRDAGLQVMRIAVNISAVELRAHDFIASVGAILHDSGLDAHLLEMELTETSLMMDSRSTKGLLLALRDMGIQLALDDFGTGYSSLTHLRTFPIGVLKIDRSFVSDVNSGGGDASIVSGLISLGRSLNLRVVAEGVETREQLQFLRAQHCQEGQGYYLGKPMPAEAFLNLMAAPVSSVREIPAPAARQRARLRPAC